MLKTFLFFILLVPLHLSAQAGWVIIEHTQGEGPDGVSRSTLYIQNNMIRSVSHDHVLIFDLNEWLLTYINPGLSGYWTGPPAEYLHFIKEHILDYLKKEISAADEYDKPFLQAMYEDLKFDMEHGNDAVSFIGELPVEIIMTDEWDRILGYGANQFLVYADREMVEEIWLTRDISLDDEYDFEAFRSFVDEISWGGFFQDYRSSESYIHLMRSGLPLRTIEEGDNGSVSITEVVNIEETNIPESEFRPPIRYKPMSLSDLGIELHW